MSPRESPGKYDPNSPDYGLDPMENPGHTHSGGGSSPSVQWVDLGLVDLVSAIMDGPTTLYDMPEGSFLASLRFTDDPATVQMDTPLIQISNDGNVYMWAVIGTEKSFGWNGFAGLVSPYTGVGILTYDSGTLASLALGYGPDAALDAGIADFGALVLSAASVGPIQVAWEIQTNNSPGQGARVAAINAWAALTNYDSPADNTLATPGALLSCAILENGTIWINDGLTGTSGGSAPDFAGNAGGSVTDGPDIVWYDTTSPPPTVGAIHVVAEIVTPIAP